jgi:hypothetical protein
MIFVAPRAPTDEAPRFVEPSIVNDMGGVSLPWANDQRLRIVLGRWAAGPLGRCGGGWMRDIRRRQTVAEVGKATTRRQIGPVRLRWLGESSPASRTEGDADVADVLSEAAAKWFASNNSPDAFVLAVVVERDGATMSDEEADAYLRDRLAVLRCIRG